MDVEIRKDPAPKVYSKDFLQQRKMQGWVIALIVAGVVLVLGIAGYFIYKKEGYSAPPQTSSAKKTLVLFSRDGCPHCENLKPVWAEFVRNMEGHVLHGQLQILQPSIQEISHFKNPPSGVPTIRLYPKGLDGVHVDFHGDRTVEKLIEFVQSH